MHTTYTIFIVAFTVHQLRKEASNAGTCAVMEVFTYHAAAVG